MCADVAGTCTVRVLQLPPCVGSAVCSMGAPLAVSTRRKHRLCSTVPWQARRGRLAWQVGLGSPSTVSSVGFSKTGGACMLHTQHGKCALLTDGPPMSSSTQTRTAMTQATRSARAAANYIPTDAHVADKLRRQRHKCSPWEELQYTVGKQSMANTQAANSHATTYIHHLLCEWQCDSRTAACNTWKPMHGDRKKHKPRR